MRAPINNALLRSLPLANLDIRDMRLKGFMLRCRTTGAHSYLAQYGRGRYATLSGIHELKPAEVRQEATNILGDRSEGARPYGA